VNDIWVSNYVYIATEGGLEIFRTPPYASEIDFKYSEDPKAINYYVGRIGVGYGLSNVISVQDTGNYTYLIANGQLSRWTKIVVK
jgi:hypothetical protein